MKLLETLNAQQRQAVTADQGPVLVLAGPGSGKTRVLTHRIAYLVSHVGVPPHQIMAVTFTNKAAREMGKRVAHLLDETADKESTVRSSVSLGTFHSLCARMLRREADRLPFTREYVIYDDTDQQALIRDAFKALNIDPKQISPRKIHGNISRAKNELIELKDFSADNYNAEITRRVYERYQKKLRINNALDFDDLLLFAVHLLQEHDDLRLQYQQRYRHILVDEFQDTNTAQYVLLRNLAGIQPDLFVVGDPDQSIYRWRGADYRNVHRFRQDYPEAQLILLEQNYRSTQTILDAAMAVIDRNPNRQPKRLFTERGEGVKITLHEAYNENDEAAYIVDTIANLTLTEKIDPGDCAVMYRTNAQSRALEEAFLKAGLAYRIVGAQRFYGRREIKDVIAYLRLIHNPHDQVALLRVINTPPRSIGAKTIEALLDVSERLQLTPYETLSSLVTDPDGDAGALIPGRTNRTLTDFGRQLQGWLAQRETLSIEALIDRIMEDINYRNYIDDGTEEGQERWGNVLELRAAAEEFAQMGLTTFLEHVALVSDQDTLTESLNAPTLLTLHAAKGLEFPIVFIIGLDNGVLPHQRSFNDPEAMAEERRLFYVGITRAKNRLFLLRAFRRRQAGVSTLSDASPFLDDLPPDHIEGIHPNRYAWDQVSFQRQTRWRESTIPESQAHFQAGMRVVHPQFGEGTIISTQVDFGDEEVTVIFDDGETKHLVASLANLEILAE
jgi:DNA helicase-2/ATP-dependent DNA helicase PcrA